MSVALHKGLPVFSFKKPEDLHVWFEKNYICEEGFWLRYYKKATNKPTISHDQAIDEALCWGWIDGLGNKYDDLSWVVRFTPRRAKSVWSKVNVEKVDRLTKEGRMRPSGQSHVDAAKADGRWEAAYAGQATITVPPDFISLLGTDSNAIDFYESLNKANKYAIAYRIAVAVGKEKKQKKMEQLFNMLKMGKSFH